MRNSAWLVISGFPGIGKTHAVKELTVKGQPIFDSDSSTFDKAYFPDNYLDHVEATIAKHVPMLVSSHEEVRQGLEARGIQYILVYPEDDLKEEYLQRYRDRGSPDAFVEMMESRWEDFIASCDSSQPNHRVRLSQGQYLSDILNTFW